MLIYNSMSNTLGTLTEQDKKTNNDYEKEFTLPEYNYTLYVKSPEQLGMSSEGSLDVLGKDITGLIAYTDLLISGVSKASATGQPFGPKYFVRTPLTCKNENGDSTSRYIYFNFIPDGTIPLGLVTIKSNELRGLVPGIMSNVAQLDPANVLESLAGNYSAEGDICTEIEMEVIDKNNKSTFEKEYVSNADIKNMSSSWFRDNKKPALNKSSESFIGYNANNADSSLFKTSPQNLINVKKNNIIQIMYYNTIGLIGIYIIMRMLLRGRPH